eukprot:TRINITY_DN609_c0_g1_i1.p1 TRINITY_DN609_c0_g1~~TRINITY_DN609_c0_g1_i1.p1  ORF type:complete len:345 (-),score=94.84 TRINITY_DN609_c0_g1_i1:294-1301(-)
MLRLVKRAIDRNGQGFVSVQAVNGEGLWHAFHLIQEGDLVRATTVRKVQNVSSTGSMQADKVKVTLTLRVAHVHFTPEAENMRVSGVNTTECEEVRLGAHHALDLQVNRQFSIEKEHWDSLALERLTTACDPTAHADVAAIIMNEGTANLCLITESTTVTRAAIDTPIPRKRKASVQGHEKALTRFFESVLQALLRHVDFTVVKCVVIASPGFVREQFHQYLIAEANRRDIRELLENQNKIILAHSSSEHKSALKEVFEDQTVMTKLADTKAAGEVRVLNEFFKVLKQDVNRAVYGFGHVTVAHKNNAIRTLLVTDELFRCAPQCSSTPTPLQCL